MILVAAVVGVLCLCGMFFWNLYVALRVFSDGFPMIPQDCILLQRDISGHLENRNGLPIANANIHIQAGDDSGFKAGKIDLSLRSDQDGHFGAKGVSVFACDRLMFQITTGNYPEKQISFIAAQEIQPSMKNADPDGYGSPEPAAGYSGTQTPVLPREFTIYFP